MLRNDALEIFKAAVEAVKPKYFIPRYVQVIGGLLTIGNLTFELNALRKIIVVGAGKAAAAMAYALEQIEGLEIHRGIVVTKYGHALPLKTITCIEAAHPLPDAEGVRAAKLMNEEISDLQANDLVICLISGGASALLADIPDEVSLEEIQELNKFLLRSGATIAEMNTIRKHLSTLKGGQLRKKAYPATLVSLIVSDVVGDPLDSIASGLTVADRSTFAEAVQVLKKYNLFDSLPSGIRNYLRGGIEGQIPETPKYFPDETLNILTASNSQALKSAAEKALSFGYPTKIITDKMEGEVFIQAEAIMQNAFSLIAQKPFCFLYGGETTVTISGNGKGGRNQHLALAALLFLKRQTDIPENFLLLSAGTDGTDGPTDATGAMIDRDSLISSAALDLDPQRYFRDNDSYNFFKKIGGQIISGPTETNVMDIIVVLVK